MTSSDLRRASDLLRAEIELVMAGQSRAPGRGGNRVGRVGSETADGGENGGLDAATRYSGNGDGVGAHDGWGLGVTRRGGAMTSSYSTTDVGHSGGGGMGLELG